MSRLVTRSAARTIRGCQEKTRSAGGNIRKLRKSKRLTLEQLAEKAESTPMYLGGVERGDENIGLNKLAQVASALRVDPCELLLPGGEGELTDELIASIKTVRPGKSPLSDARNPVDAARSPHLCARP